MLRINAPKDGNYEVYRIAGREPLQFISEQIGYFNEDIELSSGNYLVLADCSYETIIIYPGTKLVHNAHTITFSSPRTATADDDFSIECNRFDQVRFRQQLKNRFSLNVLPGKRELLVGMVPLQIILAANDTTLNNILEYKLAALQVAKTSSEESESQFFVSPVGGLLSVTKPQSFGHWHFLVPGSYFLEVNGTKMEITLNSHEEKIINPSHIRVTTSQNIDLDLSAKIRGTPQLVEINHDHWLNLNETYPVLPGEALIGLNDSTRRIKVQLKDGELTELKAKSVTVDLGCEKNSWSCLGSKDVMLHTAGQSFPFAQGVSDTPILYIEDDVWIGIEGSRNILSHVPNHIRDAYLKVGYVKLTPVQQNKPGLITDLARVEALGGEHVGSSLDLPLTRPTTMPLISGSYRLAVFNSLTSSKSERWSNKQQFNISPGQTLEIPYNVSLSKKRIMSAQRSD